MAECLDSVSVGGDGVRSEVGSLHRRFEHAQSLVPTDITVIDLRLVLLDDDDDGRVLRSFLVGLSRRTFLAIAVRPPENDEVVGVTFPLLERVFHPPAVAQDANLGLAHHFALRIGFLGAGLATRPNIESSSISLVKTYSL